MKIRKGFVSNSSSSSFIIKRENVTDDQLEKIKNYNEYGKSVNVGDHFDNGWQIEDDEKYVRGWCSMNNFNMYEFLEYIGVNFVNVNWRD